MITQWQSGETIVGRLRVKGARIDPALAQLRLATLLNSAVSQPTAFPPSAIVFIRKLHDPLPRSIRLQQHDLRPPVAWQQALNAKLESLATGAARPALGAVPANAEAVVFLDRSELLASLASDWCEGQVAMRWWWQCLLKKTTASQIIKELWRSTPEYVPAAFDKLARSAKAATFVRTFSEAETHALLNSVARVFRLDDLVRVLNAARSETHSEAATPRRPEFSITTVNSVPAIEERAPWNRWVHKTESNGLRPEQQMFLGIVLMIQRAPATVRAQSFAREVETWRRPVVTAKPALFDHQEQLRQQFQSDPQIQSITQPGAIRAEDESSTPRRLQPSSREVLPADTDIVSPEASKSIATETILPDVSAHVLKVDPSDETLPPRELATPPQREAPSSPPQQSLTTTPELDHTKEPVFSEAPLSAAPDQLPLLEFEITTGFGGIFYLINLGIYFGLYGDFTTPQEPGIDLNIWDFVALLGRELIGERIEADPVWKLLERLASRKDDEAPGSGVEINIRDWLDELMPSVRALLQKALGLTETEDPGPLLCEQPARICVTPTHVDVLFTLDRLPIQIRLAGLDRDPGWIPAAGRFINFHYE